MVDLDSFRAEFPVLAGAIYMNSGTDGPVPRRAADAAAAAIAAEVEAGRAGRAHWERVRSSVEALRGRVARLSGAAFEEIALTRSATDGVNLALTALDLGPGDEVLTTDEEHPGVLAPLAAIRERKGVQVRVVPWESIASSVGPATALIACSHVSWVTGRVVDTEGLRAAGVPLLYDGAQGLGAVPVDVVALGCDFYAAAGQKWLSGPDGTGYLYVRGEFCTDLVSPWPSYITSADPQEPLAFAQQPGALRFDMGVVPAAMSAWAVASFDVFDEAGYDWVLERGPGQAAKLAGLLEERGLDVAPRGRSTLVSWRADDSEAEAARLADEGVLVRWLPGRGLVRASVGAWTTDEELERVAGLAASS